jgi:hypothetical protein
MQDLGPCDVDEGDERPGVDVNVKGGAHVHGAVNDKVSADN